MSLPATDSRIRDAARRFEAMPLSELIAEWEEVLFESERILLAEELEDRGYRVKSLPLPTNDFVDGDPTASAESRAQLAEELAEEVRQQDKLDAVGGAAVCYLIAGVTVAALAAGASSMDRSDVIPCVILLGLAAVFVALGRAISRGSLLAASTALTLYGLGIFGLIWRAIETEGPGDSGFRVVLGIVIISFFALLRSALALSTRGPEENERQEGPS